MSVPATTNGTSQTVHQPVGEDQFREMSHLMQNALNCTEAVHIAQERAARAVKQWADYVTECQVGAATKFGSLALDLIDIDRAELDDEAPWYDY